MEAAEGAAYRLLPCLAALLVGTQASLVGADFSLCSLFSIALATTLGENLTRKTDWGVLGSPMSAQHKLESPERREPQQRKCLGKIGL